MVEVLLNAANKSVLDVDDLVGLIGNAALVGDDNDGESVFFVEVFAKFVLSLIFNIFCIILLLPTKKINNAKYFFI